MDREEKPEYQLNVEAFDGQQKTNTTVYIILQDSNDNCPVFQGTRLVKVPEDTINNTVIYNLTATDEDWGKNGLVSFYMNDSGTTTQLYKHCFSIYTQYIFVFQRTAVPFSFFLKNIKYRSSLDTALN